jgi:GNAT superfamily N-acetyltransferase
MDFKLVYLLLFPLFTFFQLLPALPLANMFFAEHRTYSYNKIMVADILIREASPDEAEEIVALVQKAYGEYRGFFPPERWQAWMDNIWETVNAGKGVLIVAEDQGRISGVIQFHADASQAGMGQWPRPASSMRILAVDPLSRGKGLGTLLVKECITRAQAVRSPRIYLYTGTFMQAARHIYEKLGFQRATEFDRDPGPIAYRLDL